MERAGGVDGVQGLADALVLSLFEAMRSEPTEEAGRLASDAFLAKYYETVDAIDSMVGVQQSRAEIMAQVKEVSQEYQACRERVLALEAELLTLSATVENELNKNLCDANMGLSG